MQRLFILEQYSRQDLLGGHRLQVGVRHAKCSADLPCLLR